MIASASREDLIARLEGLRARFLAALHQSTLHEWLSVELTMPQWKVLMTLHAGRGETVSELAQALNVRPPTVSGILDRLEAQGLVARTSGSRDRRVVCVRLTTAGADLATRVVRIGQQRYRELLGPLDEGELRTVIDAFDLLCRAAEVGARTPIPECPARDRTGAEERCHGAA